MDKLRMHSVNKVDENVEKIAKLFPNCVTEAIVEGRLTKVIDFDQLKQELSSFVIEGNEERYQFTWPDKKKSILLANAPIAKTLRPCSEESVDFDNTENLYIEGDNLEVLKLLQETYLGKIKMIYIDPPYNTGNDFVYEDDYAQSTEEYLSNSGQYDEEGNRLVQNTESNGRFHTDWLNMIYPRLKLSKDLLSEDGVIFISIDDNELDNLIKICDEIFGASNHQATISYVRKTSGKQDSTNFMKSTEYILVYSKSDLWECAPLVAEERVTDRYNKMDDVGRKYRETDLRKTGSGDRREDRPLMFYPFYYNPQNNDLLVRQQIDNSLKINGYIEILPIKPDGSEGRWRWGYSTAVSNIDMLVARVMPKYKNENKYTIYEIDYIDKNGDIRTVKEHTSWDRKEFNSDNAMLEFKNLGFNNQLFPFPKSSSLMKHIVYLANSSDGIYLDFFSGSSTTAQGIMRQNAEDNGNRKFIMVQLPEETEASSEAYKAGFRNICEIGKERIRRAGTKIKEEAGLAAYNLDTGFRVLKVDTTNMKDVYYSPDDYNATLFDDITNNVKEDRTSLDLLFQVMLEMNVLLSSKIEEIKIGDKNVFSVMDDYLIACFDEGITSEVVETIAKRNPYYAVFRDSCMADDSTMTSFDQIFETYSRDTIRKVL
ncbi:MAG TPA: site-specific DNA-methyltransferase [Patescibacteria group bacterium]|nr:site-specific DNA-methyltransferase [Patescibacteria group bacterium]